MTCNSLPFLVLDLLKTTCGRPEEEEEEVEVEVEVEEVLGKQSQPKKERKKENA